MRAILLFIVGFSFCTKLIQSSCLSYGHSCWGAHGKRSSIAAINPAEVKRRAPPDQWGIFEAIPKKDDATEPQMNDHISPDDNDIIKSIEDPHSEGLRESDREFGTGNSNDDLTPKQPEHGFLYNQLKYRRQHASAKADDGNRVLTPEDILTARKIRVLDFLMKRNNHQYPRPKHA